MSKRLMTVGGGLALAATGMELPGGTSGAPMGYMVDGRQYIVVAIGWDDMPSESFAFPLPE